MTRVLAAAVVAAFALAGCDKPPRGLTWEAVFVEEGDIADVAVIRVRILRRGCASTDVVHDVEQPIDEAGEPVPVLSPGVYGFELTARSEVCDVVSVGCAEAILPFPDGHVVTTALPASLPPLIPGCPAGTCNAGRCEAPMPDDTGVPDAPDGGPIDAPMGCTTDDDRCADGIEVICDTSTGDLVTAPCALGCSIAEPRCARLVPSNVPARLVDPAASDWIISSDLTFDTDGCATPSAATEVVAQVGARDLCAVSTGAFTVTTGATLRVQGSRPLVIVAARAVTIDGVIDAGARTTTPGPGGGAGGGGVGDPHAEGLFPGRGGVHVSEFADGGGGGGGLCGTGGAGGRGGSAAGGAGGGAYATDWDLSPLQGGGGGGIGIGNTPDNWDNSGLGGGGGGAVQITSAVSVALSGSVLAGGGGGRGGTVFGMGGTQINIAAGGGGGSGGAVLVEAPEVMVTAAGGVGATGGGGGGTAGGMPSTPGQNGGDGGFSRGTGGVHGGTYKVADGSRGGGGVTVSGVDGESNTEVDANGGGGGGGVGCVLIRNAEGGLPVEVGRSNPGVVPALRALPVARD